MANIQEVVLSVPDVSCQHCVKTINGALGFRAGRIPAGIAYFMSTALTNRAAHKKRSICLLSNHRRLISARSVCHSGRAAIAARAGIHNHWQWLWIPGSRASPAPRNDESEFTRVGIS